MKRAEPPKKPNKLLGLGLDNADGETRMTRGKNFTLLGGSEQTHAMMQETALKVNEKLDRRGKSLDDVSPNELGDILREVSDKIVRP